MLVVQFVFCVGNKFIGIEDKMKKSVKVKPHPMAVILFVLYLLLLFYLLFFSETYGRTMDSGYRYNLEPL